HLEWPLFLSKWCAIHGIRYDHAGVLKSESSSANAYTTRYPSEASARTYMAIAEPRSFSFLGHTRSAEQFLNCYTLVNLLFVVEGVEHLYPRPGQFLQVVHRQRQRGSHLTADLQLGGCSSSRDGLLDEKRDDGHDGDANRREQRHNAPNPFAALLPWI